MKRFVKWAVLFAILSAVIGCSRKTVSKIVTVHDTVYQSVTNLQHTKERDSIYIDRWHTEWLQGNTGHHRDSIYCHVERTVHDTIREADTVYTAIHSNNQTDTVIEQSKKQRSRWWIFFAGILSAVVVFLILSKWRK